MSALTSTVRQVALSAPVQERQRFPQQDCLHQVRRVTGMSANIKVWVCLHSDALDEDIFFDTLELMVL
jgi:hypothetical protein